MFDTNCAAEAAAMATAFLLRSESGMICGQWRRWQLLPFNEHVLRVDDGIWVLIWVFGETRKGVNPNTQIKTQIALNLTKINPNPYKHLGIWDPRGFLHSVLFMMLPVLFAISCFTFSLFCYFGSFPESLYYKEANFTISSLLPFRFSCPVILSSLKRSSPNLGGRFWYLWFLRKFLVPLFLMRKTMWDSWSRWYPKGAADQRHEGLRAPYIHLCDSSNGSETITEGFLG
jgi:hypothetical protein